MEARRLLVQMLNNSSHEPVISLMGKHICSLFKRLQDA